MPLIKSLIRRATSLIPNFDRGYRGSPPVEEATLTLPSRKFKQHKRSPHWAVAARHGSLGF